MKQFKDKNRVSESAPTGLFTFPILMAADILLYDTNIVPVGNDQKQHIELCRDIAIRINNKYEGTFVVPEGSFLKEGARVMSLDDPTKKMSKSAENPLSRISLLDEPATIKKAIMQPTTGPAGSVRFDIENKPGISNLLSIYSAISGKTIEQLEKDYEGQGYGNFKKDLVEVVVDALAPIRENFEQIRYTDELVRDLKAGVEAANEIACKTLARVKDKFGLGL